jgi:hypothetical protein
MQRFATCIPNRAFLWVAGIVSLNRIWRSTIVVYYGVLLPIKRRESVSLN